LWKQDRQVSVKYTTWTCVHFYGFAPAWQNVSRDMQMSAQLYSSNAPIFNLHPQLCQQGHTRKTQRWQSRISSQQCVRLSL